MNNLFAKLDCTNLDISKWDVSKVRSMSLIFDHTNFNGDISRWDVSSVTNMGGMFSNSPFNGDISRWNVSNSISCAECLIQLEILMVISLDGM